MVTPDSSWGYILVIFVTTICVILYKLVCPREHYRNLPPGPKGYPLIGSFLQLTKQSLGEFATESRKIYGDIFTVRIFGSVFIFCTGPRVLKEMFVTNGQVFRDRPEAHLEGVAMEGNGLMNANGEAWKKNRRFALHALKDFGMGKNILEVKIHEEINCLLHEIDSKNGEAFDIKEVLQNSVANVISSIVFGRRFEYDDEDFKERVENIDKVTQITALLKKPWFRYIPGDPFRVREYINRSASMNEFYKKKLTEHFENFDRNNIGDLIDAYIREMDRTDSSGDVYQKNTDDLMRIIHDLFFAGTETTSAALRWGLVYLIRDSAIQTTIQTEIDNQVSPGSLPTYADKARLPYLQATLLEILRLANIVPLIDRMAWKDTEFREYSIPKNVDVIADLGSVLWDGELWNEPHDFKPSRFLEGDDQRRKLENFLPFGLGARVCPGESLARMELYLFMAAILQRYEFRPPEGQTPPSLDCYSGITRTPKPFKLRAIKRSS